MRTTVFVFLAALAALLTPAIAMGEGDASEIRAKIEKWVETRRVLSKERSDWLVDKESLEATRDLLRQERKALRAEIAELEETRAGSDEERRDLLLKRGEFQRSSRSLETEIVELERAVLEVVPRLPEPLQQRLELLIVQIPEDPESTNVPLGQRLMNILGVLAQAEKFNATATFVGETRAVGGDQKVQVRTLYWGLGQAIYVDAQGSVAGVGRPTDSGWEFVDDPDLTDRAQLALDMYEGNVDTISFIPIPVDIQ